MDEELEIPNNHPGVEDGYVDANGDQIVHELDENGNVVGWHKEATE